MSITGASSAYWIQVLRAPGAVATGRVRGGSSAAQVARRVVCHPLGRPSSSGLLANIAATTGARSWAYSHCASTSGRVADVHLERRGAAHHRGAGRAERVEVGVHRAVARLVDDAGPEPAGVGADADDGEPGHAEAGARLERVGLGDRERARAVGGGRRADLELPAGLEGDAAGVGQRAVDVERGPDAGRVGDAAAGGVDHEPLELQPDAGRPGAEPGVADHGARVRDGQAGSGGRHGGS